MPFFQSAENRRRKLLADPFPSAWLEYLNRNVVLSGLLSAAEQSTLHDALRIVIAEKYWEGCDGFTVTDEVRVTIAGQASLLLLGLDNYYFDELQTILIYPGDYLGAEEDPLHHEHLREPRLGEALPHGPVALSWRQARRDGRRLGRTNLVLHEFAHKLAELGDPERGMPRIDDSAQARRWRRVTKQEYRRLMDDVDEGRPTVLDPYGATHPAEFFAVATEAFFLRPTLLRERHADLYDLLRAWYRQDPAARAAPTE